MKNASLIVATLCVVLSPFPALGFPVAPCRLRLAGRIVTHDGSHDMQVAVRLTVHGDPGGPPQYVGRMRCMTSRYSPECFFPDTRFVWDLDRHSELPAFRTHFSLPRIDSPQGGACEFDVITGYPRANGCFGSIIGTFECPPEGVVPVRGLFGLTVDTCRCLGR